MRLSEEAVLSKEPLEIIFTNKKTRIAAEEFIDWLKKRGGKATKNAVSEFAKSLERGKELRDGTTFKYSRRNFYLTVIKKLVDMGFLRRNVPHWDERLRRTLYVYMVCIFDIPKRPPSIGFWRIAYHLCRKWNQLFSSV